MSEDYITQEDAAKAENAAKQQKQRIASDPQAVLKFVAGVTEVEDWVTGYPDKALNKAYREFRDSIQDQVSQARAVDPDDAEGVSEHKANVEKLEAEIKEWDEKLSESAVHFNLKGVSRSTLKQLRKAARKKFKVDDDQFDPDLQDDADRYYKASVIAAHLEGYDIDKIVQIEENLPGKIFNDLWASANALSISDDFLRGIATPDFS